MALPATLISALLLHGAATLPPRTSLPAGATGQASASPRTRPAERAPSALDAREVLERSAAAIGGLDRLRSLAAARVEEQGLEYLITAPGEPGSPRRFAVQTIDALRRAAPWGLRRTTALTFPTRPGRLVQTLVASDTVASSARAGAVTPGSMFDLETAIDEVGLAPERILLTALAAPEHKRLADTTIAGTRHHVIEFPWGAGQVRLAIDAGTWFPTRVRLTRAYPSLVFWAMWGDVALETTWSSWSLESNGVWYPRQRTTTFNGEPFREYVVTALDFAPAAPADSFAIADSVRGKFAAAAAAARRRADPTLTPKSVADGVILFQGGYQAALVRVPRGLLVLEAPESDAKSRAVLRQAAQLFPGRRVVGVVSTSPLWMHIAGLREYARRRIPIYLLDQNVPVVRQLLAAPHDPATADSAPIPRRPDLRPVHDRVTIGRGDDRIELIPAHGIHSASMMLAYWPAKRLLYASDIVIPPTFEPVFTAAYAADLRRVLDRLAIPVTTVFTVHLPAAPWPPPPDSSAAAGAQR